MKRHVDSILRFVAIWFLLVVCALLYSGFSILPKTILGWILFILLAPVALFAAEFLLLVVWERFRSLSLVSSFAGWVGQRTEGEEFSFERVFWALLGVIVVVSVFLAGLWSFRLLVDWLR